MFGDTMQRIYNDGKMCIRDSHMACQQLVMKAKGNQLYLAYDTNYARDIYKEMCIRDRSGYTEQSDKIREKNRIRYHTVSHIEILSAMKMRGKEIRWKKKSI